MLHVKCIRVSYKSVMIKNYNIACDQAIYGRLISYKKQCNDIGLLLGQWHTSKAMLGALIKIFSGYGIFDVAAALWGAVGMVMLRVMVGKCMTY